MNRLLQIFKITILVYAIVFCGKFSVASLLIDGFAVMGVDGKFRTAEANEASSDVNLKAGNRWFFKADKKLTDGAGVLEAGGEIEVLPGSSVELMTEGMGAAKDGDFKVWGALTQFKNKNYLFIKYFLPIKLIEVQRETPDKDKVKDDVPINREKDQLKVPDEVLSKLSTKRIVQPAQLSKGVKLESDSVLFESDGFIVVENGNEIYFKFDNLGWNVEDVSVRLFPSQSLETAFKQQAHQLEKVRFRVAGIVTEYKGEKYLLLERAAKIYSNGNFGI